VKSISDMSQAELGAFVQSHLRDQGIDVVLSGGASVAIYSEGKYVSVDLDMVPEYSLNRSKLTAAMRMIGFDEPKSRYFIHPDSPHIVEFPPGPLSVGGEPVKEVVEIKYSTGILRVISATECVKDRLAAYYHWGDLPSLEQAVLVAKENDVDLNEIGRWSEIEGSSHKFARFRERI
jgi:hypothetical protein